MFVDLNGIAVAELGQVVFLCRSHIFHWNIVMMK